MNADATIKELERAASVVAMRELNRLAAASSGDPEAAHAAADEVLCELLDLLGYADVVKAWKSVEKWYA